MKRSEMERIVGIHLGELLYCGDPKRQEDADHEARTLLTIIESYGMLPPCDNSCKDLPEGTIFKSCNNEWEKE